MLLRRPAPRIKTPAEVEVMREAGRMVAEVLAQAKRMAQPGVTTGELDEAAGDLMRDLGGKPSFLGYHGFPARLCISIDEEVVHGIPGNRPFRGRKTPNRELQAGQLVSIDCGVEFEGYHGDSAVTLRIGDEPLVDPDGEAIMEACRAGLWAGINAVGPGQRLSDVVRAIEEGLRSVERSVCFGIVENYVGHGIGRDLHEEPQVPNYFSRQVLRNDLVMRPGLVIAIEPMLTERGKATRTLSDGWTVVTRDGGRAVHFEHTVAVTEQGRQVLTTRADGSATH